MVAKDRASLKGSESLNFWSFPRPVRIWGVAALNSSSFKFGSSYFIQQKIKNTCEGKCLNYGQVFA